jgi:NADPH:quinone reductase
MWHPRSPEVDSTVAATIPLNGLTAIQALELLGLTAGQTIPATGALGGLGIELAAMRGLRVIAATGDDDEKFTGEPGAAAFATRQRGQPASRTE